MKARSKDSFDQGFRMKLRLALSLLALCLSMEAARADATLPLAAHRAAYEISLVNSGDNSPPSGQTPVAASGLIAYEFRGSACEGYASNFRQVTQLQRGEGDAISSDVSSITYEDGAGKALKFEIEGRSSAKEDPPISGSAARADSGATTVDLAKPSEAKVDLGQDILFPTQHIERIIETAKANGGPLQARVYDGSDTGKKVFSTLTVIGKAASGPSADAAVSDRLAKIRRWPVTISYFDEAAGDQPPEYTLSFDLYENGVSGSLKLDYGAFALSAKLSKIEWLPVEACN
jgi:hypothetical protein